MQTLFKKIQAHIRVTEEEVIGYMLLIFMCVIAYLVIYGPVFIKEIK